MIKKKSTRGGSGRGQGRHPIKPGFPRKRRFLTLDDSEVAYLSKIGDGEVSRGVSRLIEKIIRTECYQRLGAQVGMVEDDSYDGVCPECGSFAVFWTPDVKKYIKNPSGHYACENGHAR